MIKIAGKPVTKLKTTQNKDGLYYYDPIKGYWGTTMDKFDTATPPKPYKKLTDGSHGSTNYQGVNIKKQRAMDISGVIGSPITYDVDVVVTFTSKKLGGYCVVETGNRVFGVKRWQDTLVHTTKWKKVGTVVKAGTPVCYLNYHHLHVFTKRFGFPYYIKKRLLK